MKNFSAFNLASKIEDALNACGYTCPTPVQAKAIPEVMAQHDVVVSAPTGTGKTASFVLPALHRLTLTPPTKKTRVLILTPTRELASQITKAAGTYGKFLKFNIVSLVGGMPYQRQIDDLRRGADIIVATPGRLMDHMEQKRVDLSTVDMLILDEADRMLDMGFIDDVQFIAKLIPSKRQTLLFSATLDSKLMNAVKHLLRSPVRIDLSSEKMAAPNIKQEMYRATSAHHKMRLLRHFLNDENIFKAIIFSATKMNADRVADELSADGYAVAALHGDLRQNVRNRTLEQLRRGKIQFLVATDVAARGIDISDITHVFNFDLPRFCEDYVHRIGRTGRAGKDGIAISFVLPTDARHLKNIERYTGQRVNLISHVDLSQSSAPLARLSLANDRQIDAANDADTNLRSAKISYAKPKKRFPPERDVGAASGRKREKSFSGEKRERRFSGTARREGRPSERSFGGGERREGRFGGGERRERSFDGGEKRERGFGGGEKRERSFGGGERRERSFGGGEKRERSFGGGEKRERSFGGGEKRERSFGGGERRERSFGGGERREGRFAHSSKRIGQFNGDSQGNLVGQNEKRPRYAVNSGKGERDFAGAPKRGKSFNHSERRERSFSKTGKPFAGSSRSGSKDRKLGGFRDRP